MTDFAGRSRDISVLQEQLRLVVDGEGATRGRCVIMTGRRRVGKSRLVQEFCDRSGVPYVFFQATRGRGAAAARHDFVDSLAGGPLPNRDLVFGLTSNDWNGALRALGTAVGEQSPCIVVLDEVPWLVEQDREFEGALQTAWDRILSGRPVLLILIGSDRAVMESLRDYGSPMFGRAARMVINPLDLGDVAEMTGLPAEDAIDALLITGGFPEVVRSWRPGMTRTRFLKTSLGNPLSPLLMAGELSLLGEFPATGHARAVLEAIGTGERTFAAIANHVGSSAPLPSGTLSPILASLINKRVISADLPLSAAADTKNKRYRISDPYLRFWLAFLHQAIADSERGRPDLALRRIERSWTSWRGRAVEPIVRESLARLLPDDRWPDTEVVGGWWNRQNNPEIDLVGADRQPASAVHFVGSVKWLDRRRFDRHDYDELVRQAQAVPGASASTSNVAVAKAGFASGLPLDARWGPDDLVTAWRR